MTHLLPKYGLEPETEHVYYSYEKKQHEKFYDCYSTYPGLNYVVRHAKFQKEKSEPVVSDRSGAQPFCRFRSL